MGDKSPPSESAVAPKSPLRLREARSNIGESVSPKSESKVFSQSQPVTSRSDVQRTFSSMVAGAAGLSMEAIKTMSERIKVDLPERHEMDSARIEMLKQATSEKEGRE